MKTTAIDAKFKGSLLISTTPVPYRIPGQHKVISHAVPGLPIPEGCTWGKTYEGYYKIVDIKSKEALAAIAAEVAYKKEHPKYVTTAERYALCKLKVRRAIYPQVLRKVQQEETGDNSNKDKEPAKKDGEDKKGSTTPKKAGRTRERNGEE